MSEARQLPTPAQDGIGEEPWENTLGAQFSASLHAFARQRAWPELCSPPAELAEGITDQAEERAGKLLDRPFLRIATLALLVQSATTAIQNLVSECSAVW
jgi:hypothetical protein